MQSSGMRHITTWVNYLFVVQKMQNVCCIDAATVLELKLTAHLKYSLKELENEEEINFKQIVQNLSLI